MEPQKYGLVDLLSHLVSGVMPLLIVLEERRETTPRSRLLITIKNASEVANSEATLRFSRAVGRQKGSI